MISIVLVSHGSDAVVYGSDAVVYGSNGVRDDGVGGSCAKWVMLVCMTLVMPMTHMNLMVIIARFLAISFFSAPNQDEHADNGWQYSALHFHSVCLDSYSTWDLQQWRTVPRRRRTKTSYKTSLAESVGQNFKPDGATWFRYGTCVRPHRSATQTVIINMFAATSWSENTEKFWH